MATQEERAALELRMRQVQNIFNYETILVQCFLLKPEGFLLKLFVCIYLALPDMREHTSAEFGI